MTTSHGPVILASIHELAYYLKNLIPSKIPEGLTFKPQFDVISEEVNLSQGIEAYRQFANNFCDTLASHGDTYFCLKTKPASPTDYPFLFCLTDLLSDIGYYGKLAHKTNAMLVTTLPTFTTQVDPSGKKKKSRHSTVKLMESIRFLSICGFEFSGLDIKAKKVNLTDGIEFEVTYPHAPNMFLGLKALSIADIELRKKRYVSDNNRDNLLRCDYRLLLDDEADSEDALKEFLHPLTLELQTFVLDLHQHFTDLGMTCESTLSTFEARFAYAYIKKAKKPLTSKEIYKKRTWEVCLSTRHGYNLVVKANKTGSYPELVETFPLLLQKKIEAGYGCDRKLRDTYCQRGCQGMRFPLDDSILEIGASFKIWLDKEVSYLL